MKNLFVMHTQYNLILSAALISRNKDDQNTLVLWAEFTLNDGMRQALAKLFDKVIVVNDKYVRIKKPLKEIRFIKSCLKKVKCLKREKFDAIYMSQERIFDLILCEMVKRNNLHSRCIDIEEDAYYSVNNKLNAPDYVHPNTFAQNKRRFLFALILIGHPYNYKNNSYCYGMSEEIAEVNLLFPNLARRELASKKLTEITKSELLVGIEAIYSEIKTEYPKSDKYMVMFFDLMNRYKNSELVKNIVIDIVDQCKAQGRTVLMKYHPRETEKFSGFDNVFEIDKLIPAEKVLYDLKDYDVIVFGNATTSCIVAAKLGFNVNSICKFEAPDNIKMHEVMTKMGINCISTIKSI